MDSAVDPFEDMTLDEFLDSLDEFMNDGSRTKLQTSTSNSRQNTQTASQVPFSTDRNLQQNSHETSNARSSTHMSARSQSRQSPEAGLQERVAARKQNVTFKQSTAPCQPVEQPLPGKDKATRNIESSPIDQQKEFDSGTPSNMHYSTLEETERVWKPFEPLDILSDDIEAVEAKKYEYIQKIAAALAFTKYEAPPTKYTTGARLSVKEKQAWTAWQRKACGDVRVFLAQKVKHGAMSSFFEYNAHKIFESLLELHKRGYDRNRFAPKEIETKLRASERLSAVTRGLKYYAIIRLNALKGEKITNLVASPEYHADRKLGYWSSNAKRGKKFDNKTRKTIKGGKGEVAKSNSDSEDEELNGDGVSLPVEKREGAKSVRLKKDGPKRLVLQDGEVEDGEGFGEESDEEEDGLGLDADDEEEDNSNIIGQQYDRVGDGKGGWQGEAWVDDELVELRERLESDDYEDVESDMAEDDGSVMEEMADTPEVVAHTSFDILGIPDFVRRPGADKVSGGEERSKGTGHFHGAGGDAVDAGDRESPFQLSGPFDSDASSTRRTEGRRDTKIAENERLALNSIVRKRAASEQVIRSAEFSRIDPSNSSARKRMRHH
ncbi:hypothetical protein MBLNU230_g2296t1 [Neophaeotheca triangularis]